MTICGECGKVIHHLCGKLEIFRPDVNSVENLPTSNVEKLAVTDRNEEDVEKLSTRFVENGAK